MDDLEYKRKRLRYLQLKAKAGQSSADSPEQNDSPPSNPRQMMRDAFQLALNKEKEKMKNIENAAPEIAGTTLAAMKASGAGFLPAVALGASGAAAGEGFRQFKSGEQLTPRERIKKLGSAGVRGAVSGGMPSTVKNVIKPIAKTAARGLERISGLSYDTPKVLEQAYNKSNLFIAPVRESVSKLYDSTKSMAGNIGRDLEEIPKKIDFVQKVREYIKQGGMVNPSEALEARKTFDSIQNKVPDPFYRSTRKLFDDIAKTAYSEADQAFQNAVKGEALRTITPFNKTGTPSIGKMILGGAVAPTIPFLSPAVQGGAASALGYLTKPILSNPMNTSVLTDALQQIFGNR